MQDKYKLTNITQTIGQTTLYQIKALKDFGDVTKGDLGGWIESDANLSQVGNCWVYENALVYQNAIVYENARVSENAQVFGNAAVYGNAEVYGCARVYGNASIYDDAKVYEGAIVLGNAAVYENASVYGNARVFDRARVFNNASVCGNAEINKDARVYRNAKVSENQSISSCHCIVDLSKNIKESIRCQTDLGVFNDEVIVYKQVTKKLKSFFDRHFEYKVGEIIEVENPDMSTKSCTSGLHGSNMNYWNYSESVEFSTFLAIKVKLEDVITVQKGKIRFKKGLVLGTYDIDETEKGEK